MSPLLPALYNHLVLPPRLPGAADANKDALAQDLTLRMIRACDSLLDIDLQPVLSTALDGLKDTLTSCLQLSNTGQLESDVLQKRFAVLGRGQAMIVYLADQNAALLVRRLRAQDGQGAGVVFESFETSASCEAVLSAPSNLQWDFPGNCAKISDADFDDHDFQQHLSDFLEDASAESLHSLRATVSKANVSVTEVRDTVEPTLVSNMLIPLLEAMGQPVHVPVLRKRIRDDVNLHTGLQPWRRLPMWLVLRVSAQRLLALAVEDTCPSTHGAAQACYKFLITLLLAEFLGDCCSYSFDPEQTRLLLAKICRRMAKLELARAQADVLDKDLYESLFAHFGPMIQDKVRQATALLEFHWKNYRQSTLLKIPSLPRRAPDTTLHLSLLSSGSKLDYLLSPQWQFPSMFRNIMPLESIPGIQAAKLFFQPLYNATASETHVAGSIWTLPEDTTACKVDCTRIARTIHDMAEQWPSLYGCDPEQLSPFILTLFELWMRMDQCVVKGCSLLGQYNPFFRSDIFDALQLLEYVDMQRLRSIQAYLDDRHASCRYDDLTLFSDPDEWSFAVQYIGLSPTLQRLEQRIQQDSDRSRDRAEAIWKRVCDDFDRLTDLHANGTCVCTWEYGKKNIHGCSKCFYYRQRKRLKVPTHEDYLPLDDAQKAAIILELGMDDYLRQYRDATWLLVKLLLHPNHPSASHYTSTIRQHSPLAAYASPSFRCEVTLGIVTKNFGGTHYRDLGYGSKPSLSSVLLPCGATFRLFDSRDCFWVTDLRGPLTLQHLCRVFVPPSLSASSILEIDKHPDTHFDGPSSYEAVANQTKCPQTMTTHEFSAIQRVLNGTVSRWPTLLLELGATNLNFSSNDTSRLLSQLAIQAGPFSQPNDTHGLVHSFLDDQRFCERLLEQLRAHFDVIRSNWRETSCMDMVTTLSLRVYFMSTAIVVIKKTRKLLNDIRGSTLGWIASLRQEIQTAKDEPSARRASTYILRAALLCRRCFNIHLPCSPLWPPIFGHDELADWTTATLALQETS